jgi:hypothetical protein
MSSQEIEIIRKKARNEGFAQGRAEGAATVRASTVVALRAALEDDDTESFVTSIIDHLLCDRNGAYTYNSMILGVEANALRDKMLGRTAQAAGKPSETETQKAERMLRENGIGASKTASPSAAPDLGDQVVALLNAERGIQ